MAYRMVTVLNQKVKNWRAEAPDSLLRISFISRIGQEAMTDLFGVGTYKIYLIPNTYFTV